MKTQKSQTKTEEQIESLSQSFNVNNYVKSNRKNRRKCKKIVHNCCVLEIKPDGSQQFVLKQFIVSCRLRTSKCLAKKAKEVQVQKDQQVAQQLLAQISNLSQQKQINVNSQANKNGVNQTFMAEKHSNYSQQTLNCLNSAFPFVFYVPNLYNFQMI